MGHKGLTPVYVITGFLDAGKTTLLNTLFRRRLTKGTAVCCIQFESGETKLSPVPEATGGLELLRFSIRDLQRNQKEVEKALYDYLRQNHPDEIWVEWNGMMSISALQSLFPQCGREEGTLGDFCKIKKILYLSDASKLEELVGGTGGIQVEQIANSDIIVLRQYESAAHFKKLRRILRNLNPGVKILPLRPQRDVIRALEKPKERPYLSLVLGAVYFALLYLILRFGLKLHGSSPDTIVNIFLGILLEAIPFLLIGVLLSSAIQIFVSQQFIERRFPKNKARGMLFAVLAGFCLPVCDCASIPVFRSLIRKGVPMTAAVTFMAATPVINPVVILSTWYAFNGNVRIVLCRVGLGILSAVIVGLTFSKTNWQSVDTAAGFSGTLCNCGCYSATLPEGWKGKLLLYFRHAQTEFFGVGKYLVLGAFVSALFQTLGGTLPWAQNGGGLLIPLLIMMGMAFFLSLCSSSDAVVARSFSGQFPMGALMGFLVFGPMMDVKNIILLSSSFSKKFILRLAVTMFLTCALVVWIAFHLGLERILL